jgi:hypothetical protein
MPAGARKPVYAPYAAVALRFRSAPTSSKSNLTRASAQQLRRPHSGGIDPTSARVVLLDGRDDNVCLGLIVRYYGNGPTYAWWRRAYGDITRNRCVLDRRAARDARAGLRGGRFTRRAVSPASGTLFVGDTPEEAASLLPASG